MLEAQLKRPDVEEKSTEAKQPVEPETFSLVQSDDQLEETEKDKSLDQSSSEVQQKDTADIPETKEESNEEEDSKSVSRTEETDKITWLVSPNLTETKMTELTEIIENLNVDKNKEVEIRTIETPTEEEVVKESFTEIIDTDNTTETEIVDKISNNGNDAKYIAIFYSIIHCMIRYR